MSTATITDAAATATVSPAGLAVSSRLALADACAWFSHHHHRSDVLLGDRGALRSAEDALRAGAVRTLSDSELSELAAACQAYTNTARRPGRAGEARTSPFGPGTPGLAPSARTACVVELLLAGVLGAVHGRRPRSY